jgi:RimJ/RimL family protein N-acetyltransferase
MDPAQQGRGYATEAVRAVMAACFTAVGLPGQRGCFAANEASWRMMERLECGVRSTAVARPCTAAASGWMA